MKYFICDVFYVPNMKNNLLILMQLLEKGYLMKINNGQVKVFDSLNRFIFKVSMQKT